MDCKIGLEIDLKYNFKRYLNTYISVLCGGGGEASISFLSRAIKTKTTTSHYRYQSISTCILSHHSNPSLQLIFLLYQALNNVIFRVY